MASTTQSSFRRAPRKLVLNAPIMVPAALSVVSIVVAVNAGKDIAHAVAHPAARASFDAVYSCLRTAVMFAFTAFTFNRETPARRARNPVAYLACLVAVGSVTALGKPSAATPSGLVLAGDIVALGFYCWVLASVLTLRRCFGLLPEARGLVTTGPYRFMRHPVYLGELGSCAGLVIAAASVFNLLVFTGFVLAQWTRMGFEERALSSAFPEYTRYASETPRLYPAPLRRRRRPRRALNTACR
jgi:protein-S-isoprenylcysteine O-methyltransferase Ste14